MLNSRIPPTPGQRRLVNVAMFVQFHLAALGHLAVWVWALFKLQQYPTPIDISDERYESFFFTAVLVQEGIPISFGILVAVYILFRCLLAYAKFGVALAFMISINSIHAVLMGLAGFGLSFSLLFVVPLRLAIPIVLYATACYLYHQHRVKLLQENESRERNEMERPDQPT